MDPAAPTAAYFCALMERARQYHVKGWWEGISKRERPFGVIRNGLILCRESQGDYCYAEVILNPVSGIRPWCINANVEGDTHPHPFDGGVLRVYVTGAWSSDEGPWRQRIVQTLEEIWEDVGGFEKAEADRIAAAEAATRKAAEDRLEAARRAMTSGTVRHWRRPDEAPALEDVGQTVEIEHTLGAKISGRLDTLDALVGGRIAWVVVLPDGREIALKAAKRWRFVEASEILDRLLGPAPGGGGGPGLQ